MTKNGKHSKPSDSSNSKQDSSNSGLKSGGVKDDSVVNAKTENKKSQKVSFDNKVMQVAAADTKQGEVGNKGSPT
jgi:hypothetical protein